MEQHNQGFQFALWNDQSGKVEGEGKCLRGRDELERNIKRLIALEADMSRAAVICDSNPSTALSGTRNHRWYIGTSITPDISETIQNSKSLNVWSKESYSHLPGARITILLVLHSGMLWVYGVLIEHPWLLPSTTWLSLWLCRLSPLATGVREPGRWWSLSALGWWQSSRRTASGLIALTSMTHGWCSTSTRPERRSSSWGSFIRASGSPVSKRSTYRVRIPLWGGYISHPTWNFGVANKQNFKRFIKICVSGFLRINVVVFLSKLFRYWKLTQFNLNYT